MLLGTPVRTSHLLPGTTYGIVVEISLQVDSELRLFLGDSHGLEVGRAPAYRTLTRTRMPRSIVLPPRLCVHDRINIRNSRE